MRKILMAAAFAASLGAAAAPAHAQTTWQGTSVAVPNYDTGEDEFYTVRFTLNDSAPKFVTSLTAQNPDHTPYLRSLFENVLSFSVTGPLGTVSFNSGTSYVSTLPSNLAQYGSVPFLVVAGTEGIVEPGYQLQFSYTPAVGYADTSIPAALDIGAPGTDAGFNLQYFDYEGDPADEYIVGTTLLNFRFASGGFVPSVSPVPEAATWAMLMIGFGLAGGSMRRRRENLVLA